MDKMLENLYKILQLSDYIIYDDNKKKEKSLKNIKKMQLHISNNDLEKVLQRGDKNE